MFSIEKTLAYALNDENTFLQIRDAITNDLAVGNPYYLQIAQFYSEFYSQFKSLPKKGDLKVWLSEKNDNQRMALSSAFQHIENQDVSGYTKEYVLNQAIEGLRKTATKNAIKRLDVDEATSPEDMAEMLEQINEIKSTQLGNIVDLREINKWLPLEEDNEIKYRTGIQKLDSYIGGFGDELVFLLGGTGIGKTASLINLGKHTALQGGNVLHITLELYDRKTAHRYYRRIAEANKYEFIEEYEKVKGLVNHWFKWASGNIHIVYYPAYSISVTDVKNIVRQYVEEHGQVDMIVLDYLDLLSSRTGYGKSDTWERLGTMSHEIRSLCPEYGCSVVSAAQANREGIEATQLKMRHMAGSVQKLQAADLVFGLVQTQEELEVNQGRLGILKVRENPGKGKEIPLYIDMDRMIVLDLDHPDSQRLIRQRTEERNNAIERQLYSPSVAA